MYETKKARFVKSDDFRNFGAGKSRKQAVTEALAKEQQDSKDAILAVLNIAKEGDDDMLLAVFEAFSMMKDINSVDDFDKWARTLLYGGKLDPNAPDRTGALIRELQGVTTHSILSGPKTPVRAIMGTASATFLRPISCLLYTSPSPRDG